jgi:hypothetical protein
MLSITSSKYEPIYTLLLLIYFAFDVTISALRCAIAEVKLRWSVIGWVTKYIISSSSVLRKARQAVGPGFICSRYHHHALRPRGEYGPFSLCVIHKEGLCPSSGDINRLMMMIWRYL